MSFNVIQTVFLEKNDDVLSPDYVPSVFSFVKSPVKRRLERQIENYKRRKTLMERKRLSPKEMLDISAEVPLNETINEEENDHSTNSKYCQTDLTSDAITQNLRECQILRSDFHILKNNVKQFELTSFVLKDDKVKVFTGLQSYEIMMTVYSVIKTLLKENSSLNSFQQFLLTCMKIKLNLPMQFLAYIFDVHKSTVSRIFSDVIDVMNAHLVPLLLFWPDTEILRATLPLIFRRNHKNCACIIDCFEVFIEKPRNLRARALTYSNYKSHNTVKYLIGIAPTGMITFISKGWGGRTSDKHVIEQCGIMDNLIPGDSIMVDRGFPIADTLALYGVTLSIPPFTRGKTQLSPLEVESGRRLSALRIHVERVIGLVRRKYVMLQSTVPVTFLNCSDESALTTLDKIVRVASALCNTGQPIVSAE